MGCYVSIKNNMNTQEEKKLDISSFLYVVIMIVMYSLAFI